MKRLSMIIACTLCFVMTANANVINEPAVTETQDGVLLNISGTVEIADRNADTDNIVFLQILNKGVKAENIYDTNGEDLTDAILYFTSTKADENGNYAFSAKTNITTGAYDIVVGYNGTAPLTERRYEYFHISEQDKAAVLAAAGSGNESKALEAVTFLSDNYMLDISQLSEEEIKWRCKCIAKNLTSPKEISDVTNAFKDAGEMYAVNNMAKEEWENMIADASSRQRLGIPDSVYKTFSNSSSEIKDSFYADALNTEFYNSGEIKELFCSRTILDNIKNSLYQKVKRILTDNSEFLGIDTLVSEAEELKNPDSAYTRFVSKTTSIRKIEDIKGQFSEAIKEAKKSENNSGNGSSSSSSSSSGGGGSKTNVSFSGGTAASSKPENIPDKEKTQEFSDVSESHWAREAIKALYEKGIINGRGNGIFNPESCVKREEFVKMAVEAFKLSNKTDKTKFSDVKEDSWAKLYIAAAVDNGIVSGITEDTFGLGNEISRRDTAVMLYRAIGAMQKEMPEIIVYTFSDVPEGDYGFTAINALFNCGIINGTSLETFSPDNVLTRAQAAKMIYEMMKYYGMI